MTQPDPHYCDHPPDATRRTGCPNWPACAQARLSAAIAAPPPSSTLCQDLAALGGWAAGALVLLAVAVLILRVWP